MKKAGIIFIIIIFLFQTGYSQKKSKIKAVPVIREYWLFCIEQDIDSARAKIIRKFGIPENNELGENFDNTYGIIEWENINIPEIGNDITIRMLDYILNNESKLSNSFLLKSEEDKNERVANLKKKERRELMLKFKDKNGVNIICDKDLKTKMVNYIEAIID